MEEFLRRRTATDDAGRFVACTQVGRLTAANKYATSAETYGERKPLRTHASLAQPHTPGNGLYFAAGHLVEYHRLPHGCHASRQKTG